MHGEVDRGFLIDLGLGVLAQFGQVVGVAEAVHHPFRLGLDQRIAEIGEDLAGQILFLVQDELEHAGQRALDGGAAQLAVALRGVRIADRKQAAIDRHRQEDLGPFAQPPIVEIAAEIGRRHRIDHAGLLGRQADHAEMRAHRNGDAAQHAMVLAHRGVVDRDAGIVDARMHHAEGIGLRRPAEIVDGARAMVLGVDLVDRHHFALLGLGDQLVVVIAPEGGGVAAEGAPGEARIGGEARLDIEDARFQHVAGAGILDGDRAGADVNAEAFARAAPVDAGVHRPGAAAMHVLPRRGPVEHAFRIGIAGNHALIIVVGVVGQGVDRNDVARAHL